MLVLDTDHLVEIQKGTSTDAQRLKDRLVATSEPFGTTIITVEEIMRGWMAAIRRHQQPRSQINPYVKLHQLFDFFARWSGLDWDEASVEQFESLKSAKIRVGTMDLRIASIVLAKRATLLSRNISDFGKVPGLTVEDWLS